MRGLQVSMGPYLFSEGLLLSCLASLPLVNSLSMFFLFEGLGHRLRSVASSWSPEHP